MPPLTTVAERINAERLALLGWPRAILLQVAHPLVAAGVIDHSSFRDSSLASARRLRQTVGAMLGIVFGDATEQARVIATIRGIHERVHGTLREPVGAFPAGTPYSAEDPALLLWVHLTLVQSIVIAFDALVAPLSGSERDAYCRETSPVAIALGATAADVPRDWAALETAIDETIRSGAVRVGTDARATAATILRGGMATLAGPVGWATRHLTIGWLPSGIRSQYGFTWSPRDERRAEWLARQLRRTRRVLPAALALWPEARPRAGRRTMAQG
jgi:uncharacterized protein (DUF2236 family)